jgi:hypothetical protein
MSKFVYIYIFFEWIIAIRYLGGSGDGNSESSPMSNLNYCLLTNNNDHKCLVTNDYSRSFGSINLGTLSIEYTIGSIKSSSKPYFILAVGYSFSFTIETGITCNFENLHVYFTLICLRLSFIISIFIKLICIN